MEKSHSPILAQGENDIPAAQRKVVGPAVGLIVCSILGLIYSFAFGVWALVWNGDGMAVKAAQQGFYWLMAGAVGLAAAAYAAMLFGSVQMLRQRSYGWAMAACIVALVPCSAVTMLSIGFGIWGILVLRKTH